jgi:acyl-CoA synthetase (AMP-forming)/AMP-acid ligase II
MALRDRMAGLRVGLQVADPGRALAMLATLDGAAELILLLSPSTPQDTAAHLATRCALDGVLSDVSEPFAPAPGHPGVFRDLESLTKAHTRRQPPQVTSWVLTTSGTTGEAKLVAHTLASLTQTTKVDEVRGAQVRWGMLYDFTRFAGLQVLLQSALSGSLLIAPAQDKALEDKLAAFARHGCTHLSGTPTLWRKIIMTQGAGALGLKQVTLGGEIADERILRTLADHYPQARVTHIYASTEAGVGFSVTDRRPGFPLTYLTEPQMGFNIRVVQDRLFLRNTLVCPHYLGQDTAFASEEGWVDTGDAVEIREDRVFFLGRANGVINVGGEKVHPEEVERVLLAHPYVAGARVYARSNPITGALVMADIVLADPGMDAKEARAGVTAYVRRELSDHRAPAIIKIVQNLDLSAAGKLLRS